MRRLRLLTASMLSVFLTGWVVLCAAEPPRDEDLRFFENRVRPLLINRCYKCHSDKKQEGDLRLDSYSAVVKGGASGAAVVAGKPKESLLVAAVEYQNEELQMPPDAKLPEEEIGILRDWVRRGIPHPDASSVTIAPQSSIDLDQGRQFWSFQPPVERPLPQVQNAAWARTPVDYFVLAALEAKGLAPAEEADKRTWIRRVTFDLTGLPPTPQEVAEFLDDHSADSWNRVVDRLLNSPRYGERWARHWLDVVRYADSNGLDENVAHGTAWRYRDYVIGSLNRDKPFDQFAREQIAGDLLPAADGSARHELLVATGFLVLGPKVLAEVDEMKMEMDIVDEQIDTFGRAFLGLTLGCARCHDHKFDPIRTDDYYGLAGIFQSTRTMESFKKVARWNENLIATPRELAVKSAYEQQIVDKKGTIEKVVAAADRELATGPTDGTDPKKDKEEKYPEAVKAELKTLREELKQLEKTPPPISSAMGVAEGTPKDSEICLRGSHLTRGKSVPRGVPAVLVSKSLEIPAPHSGRRELIDWLTDRRNPLVARVFVNRVWRWHFGRGLVETTDNFGRLGDRPANQPLLDWLAVWFMDHEWSLKELNRLIVSSSVYRQSSLPPTATAASDRAIDPDNRLLGRFPIRRLEAEAIRDSLLFVSERIDLAMGGSLLHVANREYLFDHTSKDNTKYDSTKRSVYLPVIRNNLYDAYQLFDATDATVPSGDRIASTVPTQALFMLNSNLVFDSAQALAGEACAASNDDVQRLTWLYPRCFGRPATDAEIERSRDFLAHYPRVAPENQNASNIEPWTALCHVLLASSEFMYIQ